MSRGDARAMVRPPRRGVVDRRPRVAPGGEVEAATGSMSRRDTRATSGRSKEGRPGGRRRPGGGRGRGTPAEGRPPILGAIRRGGGPVIRVPVDVKRTPIGPPIRPGSLGPLHDPRARGESALGALIGLPVTPPRNPS